MIGIENLYRDRVDRFELFTALKSEKNVSFYNSLGYSIFRTEDAGIEMCYMEKDSGREGRPSP
jgi:hypothetical protein